MFHFNFQLGKVAIVGICALVMLSCGSGEIQNFEASQSTRIRVLTGLI